MQDNSLLHKSKLYKASLIALISITLILTACSKIEDKAVISQPSNIKENSAIEKNSKEEKINEEKGNAITEKGMNYLKDQGLKPTTVIDTGSRVITVEDLSIEENIIELNEILKNRIRGALASKYNNPTTISTIALELEGNINIAELFFQEDELLGGVTYPKEDRNLTNKRYRSLKGETLEEIANINYPVWKGEQPTRPTIYYLKVESARKDGFERATQIEALDKGRYLIVYQNDTESRVYLYNTKDSSDYYTGITITGDDRSIRVKNLEGNKTAVWLPQKVVLVDRETFRLIEEIKYPKDMVYTPSDLDISPDGKMIAYIAKEGLIVTNNRLENGKLIVKSKLGKDKYGKDSEAPRYPIFSPDSKRISYSYCGYEWIIGTGVITTDGSQYTFFDAREEKEERSYSEWYDSNQLFSRRQYYSEISKPTMLNVNTKEKTYLVNEPPKNKEIAYSLGKEGLFYYSYDPSRTNLVEFGYYNLNNKSFNKIIEIEGLKYFRLGENFYDRINNSFSFTIHKHQLASTPAILVGFEDIPK